MQESNTGMLPYMVFISVILVCGLHLYSGIFRSRETTVVTPGEDWIKVGKWQEIENNRAITVTVGHNERVAIFRYDESKLSAVSNVCRHQNGPLGEGRVIDGCITCPWHGFQYRPEDGRSPAPFTEKIETFNLRLKGDLLYLNPQPLPPGTPRAITIVGVDG